MKHIVEDDLKDLIGITYTNDKHIFFDSSSFKNSIVKRVLLGVIMGWVTFLELSWRIWVRTKHVEMSRADLWENSLILKATEIDYWGLENDYL